jgi:hypothetical protein
MKAQILKLAGVKTEAEFYKKFPTEEAFMKKHGKALKKAQVGAIIGEAEEQKPIKPLSYKKTMANSLESFGIDANDPVFQNVINPQAKRTGFEKFAPLIAEGVESLAPQINEAMGVGKNGKKLKKAAIGFEGLIKPAAMPKVNATNLAKTEGFGLSKMEDIPESTNKGFDYAGAFKKMPGALASQAGTIVGGIQQIQQDKRNLKKQQMYGKVSDVVSQAGNTRAEQSKRRYVRPEDQMMPTQDPLGTGTNYLAQNGASIGGNPTEIQNMYNPGDMYAGLGYEPLDDSNPKQYAHGGRMHKAALGFSLDSLSGTGGNLGGMLGSQIGGGGGEMGPGSKIGSAVGGVLGMAIPIPGVGSFIGSTLGGLAGGLFDAKGQKQRKAAEEKLQNNLMASNFQAGAQNFQSQNSAFMEDGGYVSNDWTPQVITKFGDLDVSEVHTFAADGMPKYRAGGHLREYTPPSASAMYTGRDLPYQMENGGQMAMGGDLRVERGKAETMSYNPYLPGDGETVMFRGPSHDNGGMPVSFGQNGVEVEGGEPAIKMKEGGESENLVVLGNMKIPNYGVAEIGDDKAKGKKFKHYFADLSKQEAKQNIIIEKSTALANNADVNDPFDRLSLASANAMQIGADMKLKNLAKKKLDTVAVQNAILDTAKEFGLKSDDLAKGKIVKAKANDPYAKNGDKIDKAQNGIYKLPTEQAPLAFDIRNYLPDAAIPTRSGSLTVPYPVTDYKWDKSVGDYAPEPYVISGNKQKSLPLDKAKAKDKEKGKEKSKTDWSWLKQLGEDALIAGSSMVPFVAPRTDISLDPSEYAAEMDALATNQLQPVFAQGINPMLAQPFRISLQDQLNEITSQARSAERMAQGNPAALAMIASQAAEAKNKVLGEQLRMNQGEQARVTELNRATLNEAALKNLGIFDQQQVRQSEAQSKTDAIRRAAKQSISDKITQNKIENRSLNVMENLYRYRFTPSGVAYNINDPRTFTPSPGAGASSSDYSGLVAPEGKEWTYRNVDGKQVPYDLITKKEDKKEDKKKKRNGDIVKAIKNL